MAKSRKPVTSKSKSVLAAAGTCAAAGLVGEGLVCSVDGLVGDRTAGEAQAVTHTGVLGVTVSVGGATATVTFGNHPLSSGEIQVKPFGPIRFDAVSGAQPRATGSAGGALVGLTGGTLTGGGTYASQWGTNRVDIAGDYVPVKFTGGGQTHYGWIEIGTATATSLQLVGWGYDDVDGHLPTLGGGGGGGGVPEPGTLGLGLLALGAAGVSAYRRRRAGAKRGSRGEGA